MNDTIRMFINLDTCNKIVTSMNDLGYEVLTIEGTLLDDHYIETDRTIKLFELKPRKYIIINAIYRNTWTSDLELILTDCKATAEDWISEYNEYTREIEGY